jgi:ribonuclease BN (tRNA processing enzyme)
MIRSDAFPLLLLIGGLACASPDAPGDRLERGPWPGWEPSPRTQVVLLGTGTPNLDPDRSGPALAVVVDGVWYLVDAGPGIVRRIQAASRLPALRSAAGQGAARFQRLFLTHLHSDHTLGLPDLVFSPWVDLRDVPLEVYGPPGSAWMVEHVSAAYREDVRIRIEGLQPIGERGHRVVTREIEPGVVYRDERVTVEAFAVDHGAWRHAFGFRFETPDRVIVVSGDTRPSEALVDAARGADLLVHEVYSQERFERRSPEWQRYHAGSHTSTRELAELASQSRPGLLVLSHQLFWGASDADLLREIRERYDGPVVSGRDLDVF